MRRSTGVAAFAVLMLTSVVGAPAALAHGADRSHHPKPSQGCGFANGIKLYFRLRGIVVNVEMTNKLAQGTPASPDSRDGTLLNVAKTQRNKLCNSAFIKPKT